MSTDSKNYSSVILEIRPRLQSVNAFVMLKNANEFVDVILQNEIIRLFVGEDVVEVPCKDIKIVTNSLSSLKIVDNYLTFRFATNNLYEDLGSFKTEFLQNTVASIESLSNKPLLSRSTDYTIQCTSCNKSLTLPIRFHRILPLPSENAEPADWFCHNHGKEDQEVVSLEPRENDIFYTHCFVHVNSTNIINVKGSGKVIVCKFCLNWLGIKCNSSTVRLWFNTVQFFDNKSSISTSSLSDGFQSIKNILKYSIFNSVKLIFTCQTTSNQLDALLIWILEKKLQISFNVKSYQVAKVLFKFVNSEDELFEKWNNDTMVSVVNVSKNMIVDLLKHLHKFHKVFPPEFSKSNDFNVSYLFLYDQISE